MSLIRAAAFAALLVFTAAPVLAQEFKAGDIIVEKPWSRATPKGATVAAGYMVVRNSGATADKLVGGSADFAGAVQIHEMSMSGGFMKMRELPSGLEIPANGQVEFSPKAYHLMFTGLKQPLKKGDKVKASLTFEHAGTVAVEFQVGGLGDTGPGGAAKPQAPMKGMQM
ncbi:MAG: copper chaperone PCu(A)C [Methylobacteriaceae bacterium]|nr:copper chaperone PCu(A)C [Methylobacteriaceae bacterium]MBV9218735.1 copper chaperone PCu(A)C [Methylobacteriaceae bacterium]MBV9247275.1 copper chaperone PCu(A)C [Methylobacteriaceae bacterium]MBV9636806.1 copper chaperone PCu(A)C [Methylobacteriaceae bacterium]